tara:strand:- start:21117 stop:21566 length:450 start_codon:yes stop_codon:yes gene_type:complete
VSYCPTVQIQTNLNGFLKESLVMSSEEAAAPPTKEELIALLRSGRVTEFNRVRPKGVIDLIGAKLHKANLREAHLYKVNLSGADLSGADLCYAYLREADLREADLIGAILHWTNFFKANLIGAKIMQGDLYELLVQGAIMCEPYREKPC